MRETAEGGGRERKNTWKGKGEKTEVDERRK